MKWEDDEKEKKASTRAAQSVGKSGKLGNLGTTAEKLGETRTKGTMNRGTKKSSWEKTEGN